MPVLLLLSGPKMGFGQHVSPINVKFGMGGPRAKFYVNIGAEVWEYISQNCQNFEFLP